MRELINRKVSAFSLGYFYEGILLDEDETTYLIRDKLKNILVKLPKSNTSLREVR